MSNASKPDGTDPRILQKEGESVYIASTVRQSKGRKYHSKDCNDLDAIKDGPKEIDIAVARWKNMEPCANCLGETNAHDPQVTGADVDRIRRVLVAIDITNADVASGYDVAEATIRYHATSARQYDYNTEPTTPTVEFNKSRKTYEWSE